MLFLENKDLRFQLKMLEKEELITQSKYKGKNNKI